MHYLNKMEGVIDPNPTNPGHEDNETNQEENNDDNNAPAGPPNVPNQPAPGNPANPLPPPHQPAPPILQQQMINWSHFKPEFAGKPEEDAEVNLLHTNDWMRTHVFEEDVKVHRFCLTLLGEARLWYETLKPIANDWPALQNAFRRQYSKLGNTPQHSVFISGEVSTLMKMQIVYIPILPRSVNVQQC